MADGVGPDAGQVGPTGDQRRRPGARRHALAGGPAPGPGRPGVRRRVGGGRGRQRIHRRQRRGGRALGRPSRPRPVGGRLRRRRTGRGPERRRARRPAATCWPSATPTTWSQPGWLAACAPSLGDADVVAGVFDFWSLNGRPGLASPARRHRSSSASCPPASGPTWPCGGAPSTRSAGSPRSCQSARTSTCAGACSSRGSGSRWPPTPWWPSGSSPGSREVFRHGTAYGLSGPPSTAGTGPAAPGPIWRGAARSWLWLLTRAPLLVARTELRDQWAHAAGMRTGRLRGSIRAAGLLPLTTVPPGSPTSSPDGVRPTVS